jgi:hypothetical protein
MAVQVLRLLFLALLQPTQVVVVVVDIALVALW